MSELDNDQKLGAVQDKLGNIADELKLPVYLIVATASLFLIMLGVKTMAVIINPILLSVVITIAVLPLPQMFIQHGISSKWALVLTIVIVLGAIIILLAMVGGSIYALKLKIPDYANNIAERSQETSALFESAASIQESLANIDPASVSAIAGKAVGFVASALTQVFMTILIFIFMLSAAIAIPRDKGADKINEDSADDETIPFLGVVHKFTSDVTEYVNVTTVVNFLVGLGDMVMLMILGVDFAVLWGLLAWFLGYIPTIGFWLALIPPTILAWAEHGVTTGAIVFFGFVLINGSVQNFLQPKMMGDNLNISPLVVFISLFIWGWLLGAIGAILAVPMTLLIMTILEQFPPMKPFVRLARQTSGDEDDKQEAKRRIGKWIGKLKLTSNKKELKEAEDAAADADSV